MVLSLCLLLLASCRPPRESVAEVNGQGRGSAYLFDAELRRSGKPTSFRLEVFRTDSVMALSGRGYLGKGALRGRVTADSLLCYFPTTNEYVDESVLTLVHALECELAPRGLDLVRLFESPPDSMLLDSAIKVVANNKESRQPSFIIYIDGCPWQIELRYQVEGMMIYRLDEFHFFDGKETRLKASCREFKRSVALKPGRFEVRIPADAQRIIP